MKNVFIFILLLSLTIFLTISCEKIPEKEVGQKGKLQKIVIENLNGIPASYGPLFAVTANGSHPGWAQLWFVDDQNTIRMVRVNFHSYEIKENAIAIQRN